MVIDAVFNARATPAMDETNLAAALQQCGNWARGRECAMNVGNRNSGVRAFLQLPSWMTGKGRLENFFGGAGNKSAKAVVKAALA